MQFTIQLDGSEQPEQITRLQRAISQLYSITDETTDPGVARLVEQRVRTCEMLATAVTGKLGGQGPQLGDALNIVAAPEGEVDAAAILAAGAAPAPLDPPPPPPPSVPSPADVAPSTTAPAATPATSVAVDKTGLPWDERIHAGTRAFVADGTWRRRRGVDEALVAQVEAELRNGAPQPPPAPTPAPPPPQAGEGLTFGVVVERVQNATAAGTLSPAKTAIELQGLGVASLMDLGKRPDLFAKFLSAVGA